MRTTSLLAATAALLVALVAAAPAAAGDGAPADAPLTLAEAMALARRQAREVTAAAARVDAGEQQLAEARGYRFPTVQLQEVWMRTDSPAEAFALQLNQQVFDFGTFVMGDPNRPDPIDNALTRLEVSVPLYTGGELSARVRQAALGVEAARDDKTWSERSAALGAAAAWIDLAKAREGVELLRRSRDAVRGHVELAKAYVEQGMIVRSELLRAQVELARLEDQVRAAEGGERVAAAALAFRLGEPLERIWRLDAIPPPPALDDDLAGWLAAAGDRSDLQAARVQLRAAELEERVAKAARLPRLGLVARYDLDDHTPFGRSGESSAVMAQASIELFAGGRHRAAAAAARARAAAGAEDLARFEQGVLLDVRQAYEEVQAARDRRATALSALAAAREGERITAERFRQGIAKTIDVLDAESARREAETRELVARADAYLATFTLAVKAGRDPEGLARGGVR